MGKSSSASNLTVERFARESRDVSRDVLEELRQQDQDVNYLVFLRRMAERGYGVDFANDALFDLGLRPDVTSILRRR